MYNTVYYNYHARENNKNYCIGKLIEIDKKFSYAYKLIYNKEEIKRAVEVDQIFINYLAGVPFIEPFEFVFDRLPLFVLERVPNPRREDLPEILANLGMAHYNVMEFLIKSRGRSVDYYFCTDRELTSEEKDGMVEGVHPFD